MCEFVNESATTIAVAPQCRRQVTGQRVTDRLQQFGIEVTAQFEPPRPEHPESPRRIGCGESVGDR